MILIVGKIFRKDAWRIVDTDTEEIKDVAEENLIDNMDMIKNAMCIDGKIKGKEYSLKRLGFVGKVDRYIVIDRIIENNKIIGVKIVSNTGKIHNIRTDDFNKLCESGKIVNNDIRWI